MKTGVQTIQRQSIRCFHHTVFDNYTRHFVPFPISTFALCSVHRTSVIKRPTVDYCVILKNVRCTEHNANIEQTTSDPTMRQLHDTILMGFPEDSRSMPELTRIYHQYRSDLSIVEGVILYQDRIVIPPSLRDQVLETLHAAHQGVTSMNARAKASVFWPGITIQIQELRNNCQACHGIAPSNPKPPPTPSPDPVYPFQMICADYFCYGGHNYLVIVDRYSGWPYVCQLTGASPALVKKLREFFRDIRHRGRIGIRWRPRIHGRFHPAVPPRLGSCPPPLVGSLSPFQHPGRDRGQVSQAHDHGEHRTTRRRRYPGVPASYADVSEHACAT